MAGNRIISSDSHVYEPADLWTSRIDPRFKDRAPRIVRKEGFDWWYYTDKRVISVQPGAQTGLRFDEPEKLSRSDVFENVRLAGYVPEERIKDMDADGVDVSIVYPTVGLMLYSVPDPESLNAICSIYNDWLVDFCKTFPHRLKAVAMLNIDDVEVGVRELERCAKMGLVGGMITSYPPEGRPYDSPEYEPLWAAAQDLEMPLGMHLGTNRGSEFRDDTIKLSSFVNIDHWVRASLADIILSGVFERYPKLHVGAVEHELSWVPYFLYQLDYAYTQRGHAESWYHFKEGTVPSDYFRRNVFVSFQQESLGIKLREIIGVDNLLWGDDYPHQDSTFPRSRQILEEILSDCTEEEKAKITGGNAARIYKLS